MEAYQKSGARERAPCVQASLEETAIKKMVGQASLQTLNVQRQRRTDRSSTSHPQQAKARCGRGCAESFHHLSLSLSVTPPTELDSVMDTASGPHRPPHKSVLTIRVQTSDPTPLIGGRVMTYVCDLTGAGAVTCPSENGKVKLSRHHCFLKRVRGRTRRDRKSVV